MMTLVPTLQNPFPLIGVVHLPPMPGCAGTPGLEEVIDFAIEEVLVLERTGFCGALIENIGDNPSPKYVSEGYVHNMARVIQVVKEITHLKVGVGIINDPYGSIRAGYAARADFVRVRAASCGPANFDRVGELGRSWEQLVHAKQVGNLPSILLDLAVSLSRGDESLLSQDGPRILHGIGPDGLIVSHEVSELAPTGKQYRAVSQACNLRPIFVGSGFNLTTLTRLSGMFSGAFIGTALQIDGRFDPELCGRLVVALNALVGPSLYKRAGCVSDDFVESALESAANSE